MLTKTKLIPLLAAALIVETAASAQDARSFFSKFQLHGNVTQGFLYSSSNNYLTTDSSDGSAKWTEGTLSLMRPISEYFRAGVQVNSYSLGQLGRQRVTVDWAYADFKPSRHFGIRAGKVKTPTGLFNDIQDIDGVYQWVLLPQTVYSIDLRGFSLAHTGGVVYGEAGSKKLGSIQYQVFGGQRAQSRIEGFAMLMAATGVSLGDCSGHAAGADVRWQLPVNGLLVGATYSTVSQTAAKASAFGMALPVKVSYKQPQFYARFTREKYELAAEVKVGSVESAVGPVPPTNVPTKVWYVMGSYQTTSKLSLGAYYAHGLYNAGGRREDPANYQRDAVLNARYNLNRFLYLKLEGHRINGNLQGLYAQNNPHGFDKKTNLLAARIGVMF